MGLIIHPSSCCDVCLELFTYDEPKPPHAIPCGHIFCKDCLHTVNPRNCPLCRKAFIPERSKKIITGELPPPEDLNEVNLLKRLATSWDLEEEQLVGVTTEVEEWLRGREETPTILPLQKAFHALQTYHKLRTQTSDDRRTIRHLKREIRATIDEKNTSNAVGQSLIGQIEELHTKISYYEAEIQKLRGDLAKFKYTRNPLPAPPEPVSLGRIPTLTQSASGSAPYLWPPADPVNSYDDPVYHNHASEGEDSRLYSREPRVRAKDRKGKGKARDDRERPPNSIFHSPVLAPRTTVDGTTTTAVNGNKNAIIPGATPNQRVIPMRKTAFEDINTQTATGYMTPPELRDQRPVGLDPSHYLDPYTLTAEFVSGYPEGYVEGYQAGLNPSNGGTNHAGSYSAWRAGDTHSSHPSGYHNRSSRKSQPPPRWMTEGNFAGYSDDSHHTIPPSSAPPHTEPGQAQHPFMDAHAQRLPSPLSAPVASSSTTLLSRPIWLSQPTMPTTAATSSVTVPTQSPVTTYDNVRPRSHRRSTVQVDGNLTETEVQASDQPAVRASQPRRRSARTARPTDTGSASGAATAVDNRDSLHTTDVRVSISSWGTVDSENPPISVSDLPVHTDFSRGATASTQSPSSLTPHDPPMNEASGQGREGENADRIHGITTPRGRVASFSGAVSTVPPPSTLSLAPERRRDRRVASSPPTLPLSLLSTEDSHFLTSGPPVQGHAADTTLSYRANAPTYIPFERLRLSTPSVDGSYDNDIWTDAIHSTDDSLVSLSGNALGLHLSRSPDNALGLQLIRPSPQISAPTPIVPTRSFIRSFSHDGYY